MINLNYNHIYFFTQFINMSVIQFTKEFLMSSRIYSHDCFNYENKNQCTKHSLELDREQVYERIIFTSDNTNMSNIDCKIECGVSCSNNKDITKIEPNLTFGTNKSFTTRVSTFNFASDNTDINIFPQHILMLEIVIINDVNTYNRLLQSINNAFDLHKITSNDKFIFNIFDTDDDTQQLYLDV